MYNITYRSRVKKNNMDFMNHDKLDQKRFSYDK